MLPTPASVDWFSRNDLSGAERPAAAAASAAGVNSARERLDAQPASEPLLERLGAEQEALAEAAGIREPELVAVVEPEAGAQVALLLVGR